MTKGTAETEKLAELMRGLEIPPAAAVMGADGFFALGRAIADQAKQAAAALGAERARVCPVRTEAEWRAEFESRHPKLDLRPYPDQLLAPGAYLCNETSHRWWGWLALARHLKLIAENPNGPE